MTQTMAMVENRKDMLKDASERAFKWQSTKGTASGVMRLYSMKGNQATHLQVGEWD